jgi:hypothetical protein
VIISLCDCSKAKQGYTAYKSLKHIFSSCFE